MKKFNRWLLGWLPASRHRVRELEMLAWAETKNWTLAQDAMVKQVAKICTDMDDAIGKIRARQAEQEGGIQQTDEAVNELADRLKNAGTLLADLNALCATRIEHRLDEIPSITKP